MFTAVPNLDHISHTGGQNAREALGSGLNFTKNRREGNDRVLMSGSYVQHTLLKMDIFDDVKALG